MESQVSREASRLDSARVGDSGGPRLRSLTCPENPQHSLMRMAWPKSMSNEDATATSLDSHRKRSQEICDGLVASIDPHQVRMQESSTGCPSWSLRCETASGRFSRCRTFRLHSTMMDAADRREDRPRSVRYRASLILRDESGNSGRRAVPSGGAWKWGRWSHSCLDILLRRLGPGILEVGTTTDSPPSQQRDRRTSAFESHKNCLWSNSRSGDESEQACESDGSCRTGSIPEA